MDDPRVTWMQADNLAIEISAAENAWHAGHINDVCPIGNDDVLVASDSGGVWRIFPSAQAGSATGHFAVPLSQD